MHELYWQKNSPAELWQCFPEWIRTELHNRTEQAILGIFCTVSVAEGERWKLFPQPFATECLRVK